MSAKLDQSLDVIINNEKRNKPRRSNRARPAAKANGAAPAGGIKKNTKQAARPAVKNVAAAAPIHSEGKIIVSGLPTDVNEANIKEYFTKSAGPVKRAILSYGPNGQSRGNATIIFRDAATAAKAAKELNGLLVDHKPMRIELVIDAKTAIAAPKSLGDRVAQPKKDNKKAQPKSAAAAPKGAAKKTAGTAAAATTGAATGRKGRRGGRANRPKPKTAEELDAEMADYFNDGNPAGGAAPAPVAAPAAAPAAATEDVGMDEI